VETTITEQPERSPYRLLAAAAIALLSLVLVAAAAGDGSRVDLRKGAVFTMTNQVLAYDRARDGSLTLEGA